MSGSSLTSINEAVPVRATAAAGPEAAPISQHAAADSLVAGIDWAGVDAEVRIQQRNREVHTPPISLFRWWARRPHALIGAILEAATTGAAKPPLVSDPFSGGGTVALEAARRGLLTYAQDLHPWAIAGLRGALEDVDPDGLAYAATSLLEALEDERRRLYGTTCPRHGEGCEILTALWVRRVQCPACARELFLYPYAYVSRASRAANERWGWWGCAACGGTTRSLLDTVDRRCGSCGRRLGGSDKSLLIGRRARCQHRACRHEFDALEQENSWHLALVQRDCVTDGSQSVHLDRPTPSELRQADAVSSQVPRALSEPIPEGLETAVLRRAGLATWSDLYAPRQVRALMAAADAIQGMSEPARVKDRLRLALCGAGEMAGRVSRWDRHYPKAYEAVANHRFAVTGLSAEVNLLADRGRGVLKHRLAASVRAARWRSENVPAGTQLRRRASTGRRIRPDGVLLAHGSSSRQLVPENSVDLVLTDPPYFDDVQYAELAALFLIWARATGLTSDSVELDLSSEAVANVRRGTDADRYRQLLTAILTETRRSLKSDGRMILTYHNTDLRAWWALGRALGDAKFAITALAVAWTENDVDHSKRGRLAFTRDLVIECRPGTTTTSQPLVVPYHAPDTQSHELLTAGRVVAAMPAGESLMDFRVRYRRLRGPVTGARIPPTEQERRGA